MVHEPPDGDAIAVYDTLLKQALREIRSPATTPAQRIAWARVAEHVLENVPETEERIAEALSTARSVLDSPESVQRLIGGVWKPLHTQHGAQRDARLPPPGPSIRDRAAGRRTVLSLGERDTQGGEHAPAIEAAERRDDVRSRPAEAHVDEIARGQRTIEAPAFDRPNEQLQHGPPGRGSGPTPPSWSRREEGELARVADRRNDERAIEVALADCASSSVSPRPPGRCVRVRPEMGSTRG